MVADYNRKMAAMKPLRRVIKILEKNGIAEKALGFLVDLIDKKPEAIAKLLADSDIDPLDFKLDQASEYQATDVSVDDREITLDDVVEDLKEPPHYNATIELVTRKWDAASKQAVANEPELLRLIDSHMASGVYDLISTEVAQERMFGRITGMSDIEAYTKMGDAIHARGGFAHLFPGQKQGSQDQPIEPESPAPRPKSAEKNRRDKLWAASPSKRAAPASNANQDFNPWGCLTRST